MNSKKCYSCYKCNFSSYNSSDYKRHLNTLKHKGINKEKKEKNNTVKPIKFLKICKCGKECTSKSGYYKHTKLCVMINNIESTVEYNPDIESNVEELNNNEDSENEATVTMSKKEYNLTIKVASLEGQIEGHKTAEAKYVNGSNNNVGNNIDTQNNVQNQQHNNISINMYLNENCANAMSITDFIEQVKVSLADLEYTTQQGYIEGVSNLLIKHLQDLEPEERPIHCSNKKKQAFYIKNDEEWVKDKDHLQTDKIIDRVSQRQSKLIKEWCASHPGWEDSSHLCDEYHKIVQNVLAGGTDKNIERNRRAIKKIIGKELEFDENVKV